MPGGDIAASLRDIVSVVASVVSSAMQGGIADGVAIRAAVMIGMALSAIDALATKVEPGSTS